MRKILNAFVLLFLFASNCIAQTEEEYFTALNQYQKLVAEKQYAKAIPFAKKTASILKALKSEAEKNYVVLINSTGTLYLFIEKYDSAIAYYDTTLYLYKKYFAADKEAYLQTNINLAIAYEKNKDYSKAKIYYEQVIALKKEMYGANSETFIISNAALANIYKQLRLFEKAEDLMIENIEYYKKNKPNTEQHEIALENLADLYVRMNLEYWAAVYFTRASEVRYNIAGYDSYYCSYVSKAGELYNNIGMYDKAEICYGMLASIYKTKNKISYAKYLRLQGLMLIELDDLLNAEIVLFTALHTYQKELGNTKLEVADVYNNIGELYMQMKIYSKAEYHYAEALNIRKQLLKENDIILSESYNNLGVVYSNTKEYEKAEKYLLQAKQIRANILGTNHSSYAVVINNLALLFWKQNKYTEAEKYYVESLVIREKNYGKQHIAYARALNNLGSLYLSWKQPTKAKPFLVQAVSIVEKTFGKKHIRYITYQNNLALCNNDAEDYAEAKKQILETNTLISEKIKQNFTILAEYEKEIYADELMYNAKFANSILYNSKRYNAETVIDNFNQQLQLKALVLNESKTLNNFIQNNKDTVLQKLYAKYSYLKNIIAKEYGQPIAQRSKDLADWEYEVDVVEKNLLLKSISYNQQKNIININFQQIKNSLQNNEVAIEFVKFNLYNKGETDSTIYAAYIITKNTDAPTFVPLFEKQQLQKLLDSAGNNNQSMVSKLYRSSISIKKSNNNNFGNSLYKLIWQPLEPYLTGVQKIHFAPVDKLNSIAFNALAIDSNVYLIDKYQLYQHTSTKNIVSINNQQNTKKNIVLIGNANFNLDDATEKQYQKIADTSVVTRTFNKQNASVNTWAELPGTAEEIKHIQQLFTKNNAQSTIYSQTKATEENFKQLNNQNNHIIHIATHGFFLPRVDEEKVNADDKNTNNYQTAYDPMLRSGIVLHGANHAWNGGFVPKEKEDGIITAYEISQLNLTQTELVVLSACETALGDIKGNEGVYGLQRAFKLAGVKNLIVSLWQVPDKETAELMNSFYSYYLQGTPIKEAFSKAQKEMRKKYSPFYWAAFVLID